MVSDVTSHLGHCYHLFRRCSLGSQNFHGTVVAGLTRCFQRLHSICFMQRVAMRTSGKNADSVVPARKVGARERARRTLILNRRRSECTSSTESRLEEGEVEVEVELAAKDTPTPAALAEVSAAGAALAPEEPATVVKMR